VTGYFVSKGGVSLIKRPSTLIIAEAGVNHNGDSGIARKLIDSAADAGVDYIKFQTFRAAGLVTRSAQKANYQIRTTGGGGSQYEMLRALELSPSVHKDLIDHCRESGIKFLSTAFDQASLELLIALDIDRIKIPSGELTNLPALRRIGKTGRPVLMSTGMANLGDIESAIVALEAAGLSREHITVMHCTTEYPAPMNEVNLKAIRTIRDALRVKTGYSDHTEGIEVAIAAVTLGASVIEKHFTLDRTLPGPDHRASLEPTELKAMVTAIRNIEMALGDGIKQPSPSERRNMVSARKSLVAASHIKSGDKFSPENVTVKRPGNGISPMRWDEVMGRVASRDFQIDDMIEI